MASRRPSSHQRCCHGDRAAARCGSRSRPTARPREDRNPASSLVELVIAADPKRAAARAVLITLSALAIVTGSRCAALLERAWAARSAYVALSRGRRFLGATGFPDCAGGIPRHHRMRLQLDAGSMHHPLTPVELRRGTMALFCTDLASLASPVWPAVISDRRRDRGAYHLLACRPSRRQRPTSG